MRQWYVRYVLHGNDYIYYTTQAARLCAYLRETPFSRRLCRLDRLCLRRLPLALAVALCGVANLHGPQPLEDVHDLVELAEA